MENCKENFTRRTSTELSTYYPSVKKGKQTKNVKELFYWQAMRDDEFEIHNYNVERRRVEEVQKDSGPRERPDPQQ